MAFALRRDRDNLRNLSVRDQLTGLFNRKEFQRLMDQVIARSQWHGWVLALLMVDLDYFKTVNGRYGHQSVTSCSGVLLTGSTMRYAPTMWWRALRREIHRDAAAIAERLCEQVHTTAMDVAWALGQR